MNITRRSFAVTAAALTLLGGSACGKVAEKAGERMVERALEEGVDGNANVDFDADGGFKIETDEGSYSADADGRVRIETEDGTYTSGTGEIPENWPSEVRLPSDLQVIGASDSSNTDGVAVTVMGTSQMDIDSAVSTIVDGLSGWEAGDTVNSTSGGAAQKMAEFTKGDAQLNVMASETDEGTHLNLSYQVRPQG